MTTLTEYATNHFPHHVTEQTGGDMTLTDHTAVAHVVGSANGAELARRIRQALPDADVAAVLVRPTDPSVVPDGGEDPQGVVDLPYRRVAAAAVVGAVIVGTVAGVLVGLIASSVATGLIVGVFAAILGGVIAAMTGGGGRFAGEHAWAQPHAPDRTVAVVAAFTTTERDAVAAARIMDEMDPYEVRIVSSNGAWHSPND